MKKIYMENNKIKKLGAGRNIHKLEECDLYAFDKEIFDEFYRDNTPLDQDTLDIITRYFDILEHPEKYSKTEMNEIFRKHDEIYMKLDNKLFKEAEELYSKDSCL